MIKNLIIPALAVFGLLLAVKVISSGAKPPPVAQPLVEPSSSTYEFFIAGAGIVEPSSEIIAIAAPVAGLVMQVAVEVGEQVKRGQPLFFLDARDVEAELLVRKADVIAAQAELDNAKKLLSMRRAISSKGAVSQEDIVQREASVLVAQAVLQQTQARVSQTETEIERRVIRAPIDGQILKVGVRAGEYAATMLAQQLILLGSQRPFNVRVDIDENDSWRITGEGLAKAVLRGNKEISSELEFIRVEPYVQPKRSLTGDSSERVDTRVLQIIYRLKDRNLAVYVGQLMDVYIEEKHNEQ